jgi:chemotaxis response regulator CheB
MTELHRLGGMTIAQDEASSIIFGMPGELVRRRGASVVLPAGRVARQLATWLSPASRFTSRPALSAAGLTQGGKDKSDAAR